MKANSFYQPLGSPPPIVVEMAHIQRAKKNPCYFDPLYRKYYQQIFRYIHQRLNDIDTAKDITSQVFLKAIANLHKYEDRGLPFGSWLYRIAKSELYQNYRDQQALRTTDIEKVHVFELMEVFGEDQNEIDLKRLQYCLDLLSKPELKIIEMRFFEKKSFKQIGEVLCITENNAKVKCFRVLARLKETFRSQSSHTSPVSIHAKIA